MRVCLNVANHSATLVVVMRSPEWIRLERGIRTDDVISTTNEPSSSCSKSWPVRVTSVFHVDNTIIIEVTISRLFKPSSPVKSLEKILGLAVMLKEG